MVEFGKRKGNQSLTPEQAAEREMTDAHLKIGRHYKELLPILTSLKELLEADTNRDSRAIERDCGLIRERLQTLGVSGATSITRHQITEYVRIRMIESQ
jgi:hypothetical protein